MKPQFDVSTAGDMPRVVISGNYYNGKCFPSLNNMFAAYSRSPKAGSALKKKFHNIAAWDLREQLNGWKASKPLIVHYRYFEPRDGHYRDFPNVHCAVSKIVLDAAQDVGVIPNDNPKWILNETHDFFYCGEYEETRIEIYLEEVDDEDRRIF